MNSRPSTIRFLALLTLTAVLVGATWLAPEDVTLGERMRWVYLHVSLTWAGTALLNAIGLVGLYLIWRPTAMQHSLWAAPAQTSGLLLFGAGFGMSLVAAQTSWGGILWMEPSVRSSLGILAGGFVVVLIVRSVVSPRIVGILAIGFALGVNTVLASTSRIFHPDDPIDASDSTAIQMTFYAITVVAFAIGIVLAMVFRGSPAARSGGIKA